MDRNLPWWNYPRKSSKDWKPWCADIAPPSSWPGEAESFLSAAAGLNNSQIAREVGLDVDTVRFWRNRWLGLQAAILEDLSIEERLRDAPRPGAPARITPEQVCQIMSLACEAPSQCGRPISQWTSRELADEIIEKGIVERISPRHAARLLERGT